MNCSLIRRRLLALAEPAEPPALLQAHLDECVACRELQQRLMQVERHVPTIPVPPSASRADFIQRFASEATVWERANFHIRNLKRWQLTLAGAAASFVLFFLVWSLAPTDAPLAAGPRRTTAPDRLLASLVQRNLKLAVSTRARDQVETLADLAEDLRGQSQPLLWYFPGKDGKDALKDLAEMYGRVVRMSVARAGQLPADERRAVLDPIIKQLARAGDDAEGLARDVKDISSEHPLLTMAFASRNAREQMETLLRHEVSANPPLPREDSPRKRPAALPGRHAAMLRVDLFPIMLAAVSAPVHAETGGVPGYDQAERFCRNYKLIDALVENCLRMAEQGDEVLRAASCMVVADRLAEELHQAMADRDLARATELTRFLRDLLRLGIADNLTTAQGKIPVGGVREPEMLQIGDHVKRIAGHLRPKLQDMPGTDAPRWQRLASLVGEGELAVAQALRGRGSY